MAQGGPGGGAGAVQEGAVVGKRRPGNARASSIQADETVDLELAKDMVGVSVAMQSAAR